MIGGSSKVKRSTKDEMAWHPGAGLPTGGEDVGRGYQIGPGQEEVEVLCDSAAVARVSVAKAISQSKSNNFVFVIILSLLYLIK